MKTLHGIAVALVFLMANAFIPYDESKVEKSETSTSEVYAIHEIEIKQDTDAKEFEAFVLNELAPIYDKMKGQKLILIKGDRGIRSDKYAIMLIFESIDDRNRIYPPSGGFVGDFGDQEVWDKFDSMVSTAVGEAHTDYVRVVH